MAFPIIGHHPETPVFELFRETNLPSIGNLDPLLTINGATEAPVFRYNGKDATASSWPAWDYGQTLSAASTGTDPSVNQGSPLLGGTIDDSVKYNAGIVHQASDNTFAHIGTEDFVFEIVFKHIWNAGTDAICGDRSGNIGWHFVIGSPGNYSIVIQNPSGTASFGAGSGNLILGVWYHIICFADRSGSGACYLNGVVGTSVNSLAAQSATLTNTNPFTIGSTPLFVNKAAAHIAYCAMWKREAWLDTHLQATVAQERFYKLTGIYPQIAKGTKLPTSYTRALETYLDKYEGSERYLYRVGSGWPRWCHRKDENNTDFKGYLPEISVQNKLLQAENFQTGWASINASEDSNNRIVDGDMEAVGVTAWTAASATVTKEIVSPHGGTQNLKVQNTLASVGYVYQTILTVGKFYHIVGWARGDGTSAPKVYAGSVNGYIWSGTSSTSWQNFDLTLQIMSDKIYFYGSVAVIGNYVEWDDIVITEYLPLDNFNNKVIDGNMEAADTSAWGSWNGATITKETGTPYGGSKVLKIARGTGNNPYTAQTGAIDGNVYRLTGYARSDGSARPTAYVGTLGSAAWSGVITHTNWQYFDVVATAKSTSLIGLQALTSTGTQYCEFDDVRVSLLSSAPNKLNAATSLVADATDTSHGVQQVTTLTAATHIFSVFAKAGNKNWLYLSDDTVTNAYAYFNLSTVAVGTTGAAATTYIENWGNGWIRCGIRYTGTAALHTHKIQTAEADGDLTFAGDGTTINTYLFGAQVETADYMTSYVYTSTAMGTRPRDVLRFKGDDGNLGGVGSNKIGTICSEVLLANRDYVGGYVCALSDGGATGDRLLQWISSVDTLQTYVDSAEDDAASINGLTNISNGYIHSLKTIWGNSELNQYVDGAQEGTPVSSTSIPDDLDTIDIGMSISSTTQLNGLMNNLKIYKLITTK